MTYTLYGIVDGIGSINQSMQWQMSYILYGIVRTNMCLDQEEHPEAPSLPQMWRPWTYSKGLPEEYMQGFEQGQR